MKQPFFFILIFTGFVSGCAHQTLTPVIHDAQAYQQQLSHLNHWQLEGKFGVHHANKSDSAALQWKQDDDHFDIFLSGPLGADATRLVGTPKELDIQNGREGIITEDSPELMMQKRLGWALPLEKLPQWILGYSDNQHAQFNMDHTLAGFEQDGWQVEYQTYQIVGQWLLPEKIVLKHEDMQVTIVIKQWDIKHQGLN